MDVWMDGKLLLDFLKPTVNKIIGRAVNRIESFGFTDFTGVQQWSGSRGNMNQPQDQEGHGLGTNRRNNVS